MRVAQDKLAAANRAYVIHMEQYIKANNDYELLRAAGSSKQLSEAQDDILHGLKISGNFRTNTRG